MSQRAIVLFRISKGALQNVEAEFLGSMIFMQINMAAMARANLPPSERKPFFVYIDEFSVLANKSMPSAFRELRKFNVGLVVATQTWSSMRGRDQHNDLANEVLANTSCKLSFRVSPKDARLLDDYTLPDFDAVSLTRTPNHQAVVSFSATGAKSFLVRVTQAERPADAVDPAMLRHISGVVHGTPIKEINETLAKRHDIDLALLEARP